MAAEIKAEAEKIQAAGGLKIEVLAQAKLDAEGLVEEGEYALLHLTQGDKETTGFARKQDGVWKVYLPGRDETQLGEALQDAAEKPDR